MRYTKKYFNGAILKNNVLLFGLLIILSCLIVNAQETGKTSLNGHIMDTTGASAPNIKIKLRNKKGKTFETLTDGDGFYSIKLPNGNYLVEVESSADLIGTKFANYKTAPTKMTLDIVLEINIIAPKVY